MSVPAKQRKRVLMAQGGNPKIVCGNGLAFPLQFETDDRIRASCLIVDVEHSHGRDPFLEPVFITGPVSGLRDAKTVFAENDDGNGEAFGAANNFECGRIMLGSSG